MKIARYFLVVACLMGQAEAQQAPVPVTIAPSSPGGPSGVPLSITTGATSALTTFSNQTNSIGTSSTAITLGGAAITTASFATVDLWNNSTTCDVLINRLGGTVSATAWDTRLSQANSPLRLGYAIDYPVPPTGNITAIAVNAGTTVACTGGGFALQAGAH